MNILFVNENQFSFMGGVEFHILNLSRELLRRSHSVTMLSRGAEQETYSPEGIRLVTVSNLYGMHRFFQKESRSFDICHAHMSRKIFSAAGLCLAKVHGLRTVFTPHCFYPASSVLRAGAKWMYDRVFSRLSFQKADIIINLTERDRDDAIQRGMRIEQSRIVPNSIAIDRLLSTPSSDFGSKYSITKPFLLHVGRFQKHKCIDFIVAEATKLQEYDLILIGQDDGEMSAIAGQIRRAALQNRVHIIERIAFADLCNAYRHAAALVMASTNEGLPTVILEAMAFGVPVVAPNVGGIPNVLTHGVTGFLYSWGNAEEFRKSIASALANRQEIASSALRELESRFSWHVNAMRIEEIYDSLLGSSSPRADDLKFKRANSN